MFEGGVQIIHIGPTVSEEIFSSYLNVYLTLNN